MISLFSRFLMAVLVITLAACTVAPAATPQNPNPTSNPAPTATSKPKPDVQANVSEAVLKSDQPRAQTPKAPDDAVKAVTAGQAEFGLDLYHTLGGQNNLFFSPYSISLALAMTYAGARGETEQQMASALHFTLPQDSLHPAMNALDQELASRKDLPGSQGSDGKGFRLNIVNDLWGEREFSFEQAYLDLLALNYGAGLRLMDFKTNPDGSRQAINDYIAGQTEQRIKDLIPSGAVTPDTRLVLTNAIYFNAAWLFPFERELTKPQPFTRLDGSKMDAQMMAIAGSERFSYGKGQGYQTVTLPYENSNLSMLVIVPDEGQFAQVEKSLDAKMLTAVQQDQHFQRVILKMPAFTFESEFSLAEQLKAMGMPAAFERDQADFSGMTGKRDLFISDVVHKAFVKVNEEGTEAAAATAVIMEATGAMQPEEPVELTIDRPFIFFIIDQPTGAVLFIGRVVEPSAQ